MTNDEKIVGSVLSLLASGGHPVCVDDHTQDSPLTIFRQMSLAPRASRSDLKWFAPTPLRPVVQTAASHIENVGPLADAVRLRQPNVNTDPLPGRQQSSLDHFARLLSTPIGDSETPVDIRNSWTPANVTARWWPLNRLNKNCAPLYVISDPVRGHGFAFVSVRAEHWGTIYALQPSQGNWMPVAEWSRWLY